MCHYALVYTTPTILASQVKLLSLQIQIKLIQIQIRIWIITVRHF